MTYSLIGIEIAIGTSIVVGTFSFGLLAVQSRETS